MLRNWYGKEFEAAILAIRVYDNNIKTKVRPKRMRKEANESERSKTAPSEGRCLKGD
jgi:hypothetical protein